ncbi:MAG: PQQ-dependent dehydrogenase, methanol/ethanol family [Steroidobacteraceae bacterium]|nr:PQQ-dependent dehydrogenase, methanol/ethanol family [Steroidobacteraceae bacterium]
MNSTRARHTLLAAAFVAISACAMNAVAASSGGGAATVDGARIIAADQEPQNWLAHGRTYGEQRYSPLTQVNDRNVAGLGLAWSFATATTRGLQASPIVVDGTLYTTGTWSVVWALDAKTGRELWKYDPEVPRAWGRHLCCDAVNRGVAVWKGAVYVGTIDGRLVSLDARTGARRWEVNTIDRSKPYSITGAPRVVKGKVLIGNGGSELGVRGYLSAYDADTGQLAWRFYTVPGNPKDGFEHPELEQAAKTWHGEWWVGGGGGTVWDSMAYDPELDTLYVGTGNGAPWSRDIRSPGGGDNLFLSSILALDPDTGRMKWYYQTTPAENWDYTATQHIILADLVIGGKSRKVLMQAPKNGFFYVLDRVTGELLSADKFAPITWASHVDLATGRPVETEIANYSRETRLIVPAPLGAHNWHPMAFNPRTGLVYIPAMQQMFPYALSADFKNTGQFVRRDMFWNPGIDWNQAVDTTLALLKQLGGVLPPDRGYLKAWDPVQKKVLWEIEHPGFWNGGLLTTAGNLLFQGTADGRFVAYTADTGRIVWGVTTSVGIIAPPVTYAVDGEQYVAVMAGYGGAGALTSGDPRTMASAKFQNDGYLLAFKLGGKAAMPRIAAKDATIPEPPKVEATAAQLENGKYKFMSTCAVCHGPLVLSSGVVPDLRLLPAAKHAIFKEIVYDGVIHGAGMPRLGDLVTEQDVRDIQAYVIARANEDRAAALAPTPSR